MTPRDQIDLDADKFAVIEDPYRYWLHRRFPDGYGVTVFGMLNPSKADGRRNDPTTRRCIDFAQTWNSSVVVLVNLFAAIATDPDEMLEMDDPRGPRNRAFIEFACDLVNKEKKDSQFVVAWGAHSIAPKASPWFMSILQRKGVMPVHMGLVQNGAPRHPLYTPSNVELETYGW